MFRDHPGFKVTRDVGLKKPKDRPRKRSKLRARRSTAYLPPKRESAEEAILWLRAR